jgi:hypothetical protein
VLGYWQGVKEHPKGAAKSHAMLSSNMHGLPFMDEAHAGALSFNCCDLQVELQRADVTGIDFIAFRTSSRSTLSAALKLPSELRSAIRAELLPASGSSSSGSVTSTAGATVLAAVAVDGSGFFEMRGLKPGAYVLRLSCDPAAAGGRSCEVWERPVQVRLLPREHPDSTCQVRHSPA